MTPEDITAHFTRSDGNFLFARWGRPIAPVAFGVADETLPVIKGALEAVTQLAGHSLVETDPELGSNLLIFFLRDWAELTDLPDLDRMIPDLGPLVRRLQAADASQYRAFRFDPTGAIRACFTFLRMEGPLAALPAETLALTQAAQAMLLWSEGAFADRSPLAALPGGGTVLRPEVGALLRAAYDPAIPAMSTDPALALRLYARLGVDAQDPRHA